VRRDRAASDVLAEVAQGTGGEYFHDDNDLEAGFREGFDSSQVYYALSSRHRT
jgi:hypothetical protein